MQNKSKYDLAPEALNITKKDKIDTGKVLAWSMWEWGSGAFNTIITSFVFSVYLTDKVAAHATTGSQVLGYGMGIGGVLIALLAPIVGQRSDISGRRKFWLIANTILVCILTATLFFIKPAPEYLIPGVAILAIANVFLAFADVNNSAILLQVSTPKTIGKVSGYGWSMGYFGGIFALLIAIVGFVNIKDGQHGWFGVTTTESLNIRALAIFVAAWFLLSLIPVILKVPEKQQDPNYKAEKVSYKESYKKLWGTLKRIYKEDPNLITFFMASALFRDGIAAIFQFIGIIAVGSFGFSATEVLIFAVVANIIAAIGAVVVGYFDDIFGPKKIIIFSLTVMVAGGITIFFMHSKLSFWILALAISFLVGPAQSSSRTFLARFTTPENEGELFGLYTTTGRTISFIAPMLFSLCITLAVPLVGQDHAQRYGIWGLVITLLAGLLVLLKAKLPPLKEPKIVDKVLN
ncbi:MAG: MFS transporter [Micrococcaceae bacterium]